MGLPLLFLIIPVISLIIAVAVFFLSDAGSASLLYAIFTLVGGILLDIILLRTLYRVVRTNEIHVVAGLGTEKQYLGGDSYTFFPFFYQRNIVQRSVIEIAVPKIKLLDRDNLPFAVEISCKVQIQDAIIATRSLGRATSREIIPIVDDTIQAAARSQSMKQTLPTIMRERDEIEKSINQSTSDTLSRVGIEVVLFDIKNIIDVDESSVISDMERVKSAELTKLARQAEAEQNALAEITEAERRSDAEVRRQEAFRAAETARLTQEREVAEQKRELALKEMGIVEVETRRQAEIDRDRIQIQADSDALRLQRIAQAEAEAQLIRVRAQAETVRLQANADAEAIQVKLEAEASGTKALATALKAFNEAGIQIKIAEIQADAQVQVASSVAEGIKENSKLILPSSKMSSFFTDMVTGISTLKEAGISLQDVLKPKN